MASGLTLAVAEKPPLVRKGATMICTECKDTIPFYEEDVTVRVVFKDGHVEPRCHHRPFDENDPGIVAILGSLACFERYTQRQVPSN